MNNERMRDIEKNLGMAKNHLAVGFDWKDDCNYKEEWEELSNDIKKKITYISGKNDFKKAPRAGFNSVNYIVRTTIALWSVVLLASVASILFLGITNSWKFC
ncbi:unnamed protein product [marine sediment metagenome]|uniref:Uncharacterized protein n=1 Tax=marine sediment metagenome TaxID=412755 RepID=X1U8P1_9ZZZZ